MATSQFYKAAAKVKSANLARIDLPTLLGYTIRELRACVAKLNSQAKGWLFCKATLGKPVSAFRKTELINIIWTHLCFKKYAPKAYKWTNQILTPNSRITALFPTETSNPWTINLGFSSQKEAEILQGYLHQRGLCKYSVVRPGKRTGWAVELKIWDLDPGALRCLIEKEEHRLRLQAT